MECEAQNHNREKEWLVLDKNPEIAIVLRITKVVISL